MHAATRFSNVWTHTSYIVFCRAAQPLQASMAKASTAAPAAGSRRREQVRKLVLQVPPLLLSLNLRRTTNWSWSLCG